MAAAARSLGGSVKDLSGTKIESSDQIALLVFVTHGQVVECIDFPRTQGDFAAVGESVLPRSTPLVGRVSGDDRIVVEIAR